MFAMKAPNADLPRVERVAQEPLARGPSLSLRYPELRDAPALFALARDPEVTRFLSWGPYEDPRETLAWLGTLPQRRARGIALELAVVDEADQPIGITLLSDLNKTTTKAYEVVFPNLAGIGDTSARAAFVIGKDGLIKYSEQTATPKDLPNFAAVKAALAK